MNKREHNAIVKCKRYEYDLRIISLTRLFYSLHFIIDKSRWHIKGSQLSTNKHYTPLNEGKKGAKYVVKDSKKRQTKNTKKKRRGSHVFNHQYNKDINVYVYILFKLNC